MLNVSIQYYHSVYVMGQKNNCCSLRLLLPSVSANRISAQSHRLYIRFTQASRPVGNFLATTGCWGRNADSLTPSNHQLPSKWKCKFQSFSGVSMFVWPGLQVSTFLDLFNRFYLFHLFYSLNERKQGKKKQTKNQLHHTPRGKKTVQTKIIRFIYLCVLPVPFLFWFLIIKWRVLNDLWVHFA